MYTLWKFLFFFINFTCLRFRACFICCCYHLTFFFIMTSCGLYINYGNQLSYRFILQRESFIFMSFAHIRVPYDSYDMSLLLEIVYQNVISNFSYLQNNFCSFFIHNSTLAGTKIYTHKPLIRILKRKFFIIHHKHA